MEKTKMEFSDYLISLSIILAAMLILALIGYMMAREFEMEMLCNTTLAIATICSWLGLIVGSIASIISVVVRKKHRNKLALWICVFICLFFAIESLPVVFKVFEKLFL